MVKSHVVLWVINHHMQWNFFLSKIESRSIQNIQNIPIYVQQILADRHIIVEKGREKTERQNVIEKRERVKKTIELTEREGKLA